MLFIVPGPDAPVSGGNRYNNELIARVGARRVDDAGVDALSEEAAIWVDSLYLSLVPRIRARAPHARLGLLAHSLPSKLAEAVGEGDPLLEAHEAALLSVVSQAVAPSETMRAWLLERAPSLRVRVVPPGVVGARNRAAGSLRAVIVANLIANKGVLPFLEALAARVRDEVFSLRVIGRVDLDRAYAARCRAVTVEGRVTFTDGMQFPELLDELAQAHVLVSASRMESYGMAIAEARACGCLVLAHAGGHQLVDDVFADDAALADALLALARTPFTQPAPWPSRSWDEVAREFRAS